MSRRGRQRSAQRDHNTIANVPLRAPSVDLSRLLSPLSVSDRRAYHPDDYFAPVFSSSKSSRVVQDVNVNKALRGRKFSSPFLSSPTRLGFAVPKKVHLCVRRKQRREVLFAKRRTGRGARSRKHYNYWSAVQC